MKNGVDDPSEDAKGGGQDTNRAFFGGIALGDGGDARKEELERGDEFRDGFAENGAEAVNSLVEASQRSEIPRPSVFVEVPSLNWVRTHCWILLDLGYEFMFGAFG